MKALLLDRRKQLISLGILALLIGATFFFLCKSHDLPQLLDLLWRVKIVYVLAGAATMAIFFAWEAECTRTLLGSVGYRPRFGRCLVYALINFYFSAITPARCGGQPAKIYYVQRDDVEISASSLTLLLFNMAYHAAVLIVAALSIIIGGLPALVDLGAVKYLLIYGVAAHIFTTVFFMLASFSHHLMPSLARACVRFLAKLRIIRDPEKLADKLAAQISEYRREAEYIRSHTSILFVTLLLTTAHILSLYGVLYWVYLAFGLSGYSFWNIIAVQAILTIALESLPIPGEIGIAEASYVLMYGGVFGAELAVPAMLLMRGLNYYAPLAVGGIASAVVHSTKKIPTRRSVQRC